MCSGTATSRWKCRVDHDVCFAAMHPKSVKQRFERHGDERPARCRRDQPRTF